MIVRDIQREVEEALARQAAVALIGPRQVGKTTLAHMVAAERPSLYLDLENSSDRAKLAEAELFLARHENRLVILDEIHRVPADWGKETIMPWRTSRRTARSMFTAAATAFR